MPVFLLTPQEHSVFAVPLAKAQDVCACVCAKRPTCADTHGSLRWVCMCAHRPTWVLAALQAAPHPILPVFIPCVLPHKTGRPGTVWDVC